MAIITGAAGAGIGQATARTLAANGAKVIIADSHAGRAVSVAKDIMVSTGMQTLGIQCDVSESTQVTNMVNKILEQFGQIDILVNNAGINKVIPICEMTDETWDQVVKTNLFGTFYCTRAVLPHMINHRSGVIINLSSVAAHLSSKNNGSAYAASKGGIISFTKSVAAEVAQYNIRLNAIAPSLISHEFLSRVPGWDEKFYKELLEQMPMGRFGEPEEVAKTILFLASDDASYISGAVISVTGGYQTW